MVLGLTILAGLLRVVGLAHQSLWSDEGFTAQIVSGHLSGVLSRVRLTESTPPVYYWIEWGWAAIAGHSGFALRFPSALFGTLTVPAVYAAGRELADRRAGVAAAGFAALSPFLVWYSQEARAYALFALLAAAQLWLFARAYRVPARSSLVVWAALSAVALGVHYFALFAVGSQGALLLWRHRRRSLVWICVGIQALVLVALLPLLVYQHDHVPRPWTSRYSVKDQALATVQEFAGGHTWSPLIHRILIPVIGVAIVALVGAALRSRPRTVPTAALVVAAAIVPAPAILSLISTPYLAPRNVIAAWPALAVVLGAAGTTLTRPRWLGYALSGAVLALSLAITLGVALSPGLQRDDWRDALAGVGSRAGVLVVDGRDNGPVVRYYLPRWRPCTTVAAVAGVDVVGSADSVRALAGHGPPSAGSVRHVQHLEIRRLSAPRVVGCNPPAGAVLLAPPGS